MMRTTTGTFRAAGTGTGTGKHIFFLDIRFLCLPRFHSWLTNNPLRWEGREAQNPQSHLPQAAGLALRLEQHENVPLTNRPLMSQRKDSQFQVCGCSGMVHDGGEQYMPGSGATAAVAWQSNRRKSKTYLGADFLVPPSPNLTCTGSGEKMQCGPQDEKKGRALP
jgi:hypothetical protein